MTSSASKLVLKLISEFYVEIVGIHSYSDKANLSESLRNKNESDEPLHHRWSGTNYIMNFIWINIPVESNIASCFPSLEQSTRNPMLSPRYSHQWKCHISQQAAEAVLILYNCW